MTRAPAVSVLMPVYNCEGYVGQAVESILGQTFPDFELLVIDDGSTDGTPERVRAYDDPRLRLAQRPHGGLIKTLNHGVRASKAPYIARMDGDDIAHPDRFSIQMDYLAHHPDIALLGSQVVVRTEAGSLVPGEHYETGPDRLKWKLLFTNQFAHPTVVLRRDAVLEVGGYRQGQTHAEDFGLWSLLALHYRVQNLPDVVLTSRRWQGRVSRVHRAARDRMARRVSAASIAHFLDGPLEDGDVDLIQHMMGLDVLADIDHDVDEASFFSGAALLRFRKLARRLTAGFCAHHGIDPGSETARWVRGNLGSRVMYRAFEMIGHGSATAPRIDQVGQAARAIAVGVSFRPRLAASRSCARLVAAVARPGTT